jgi:hypothetical protein
MAAEIVTDQVSEVMAGGFPALGMKVGIVRKNVTLGGVLGEDKDTIQVFEFEGSTVVLAAGVTVVTPTTSAVNVSLGKVSGAECMALSAAGAAAGTEYGGGKVPILFTGGDTLDLAGSGDAGAAGVVEVWAVIADVKDW